MKYPDFYFKHLATYFYYKKDKSAGNFRLQNPKFKFPNVTTVNFLLHLCITCPPKKYSISKAS